MSRPWREHPRLCADLGPRLTCKTSIRGPACCDAALARYMRRRTHENGHAPTRAFSMKSGRSAFYQSGIAAIFFSFSRISACCCM